MIWRDNDIAEFVNNLRDIAKTYAHTQQLRAHISKEVLRFLRSPAKHNSKVINDNAKHYFFGDK